MTDGPSGGDGSSEDLGAPRLTLSVVIPCFNYARFLPETIGSVLASTRPADEIIVVDDGSSDGSAEVAASFPRVTVIQQPNGGMASAMNTGIGAATGDVVVFLDADDTMTADRLRWVAAAFTDSKVVMAWHPLALTDTDGRQGGLCPHRPLPAGWLAPSIRDHGLPTFAVTSGIAARRSALEEVGPIDHVRFRNYAEAFLVRTLVFRGEVAATEAALGTYRTHGASETHTSADVGVAAVTSRIERRLELVRAEHDLLASSARAAGYDLSADALHERDPVYRSLVRMWARLGAVDRRDARHRWAASRPLVDNGGRVRSAVTRGCYLAAPKRALAGSYAIKANHEVTGGLRLAARAYWRISGLRDRATRTARGDRP